MAGSQLLVSEGRVRCPGNGEQRNAVVNVHANRHSVVLFAATLIG
jgi:hypothetical protein